MFMSPRNRGKKLFRIIMLLFVSTPRHLLELAAAVTLQVWCEAASGAGTSGGPAGGETGGP